MAEAGALAGAIGAALLVLASSRTMLLAGLALVLGAMVALAGEGGQLDTLTNLFGSLTGVAALLAALCVLVAAAAVLVRWPIAIVPALLAVAPLRLPIASDPDSPVLLGLAGAGGLGRLYPLYGLLGAAVVALLWRLGHGERVQRLAPTLAVPLAAFLALVLASFAWSEDQAAATEDLLFLWLPFSVLFVVAARVPLGSTSPRLLAATLVGIALLFAAFGLWQAATEELLFYTVSLEQANALGPIFRVTSAFQDPNLLGRYLVLAIAVVLVAAWVGRLPLRVALAVLGVLGAGLWFTYSQSSLVALAVVAITVALVAASGRARTTFAVTGAVLTVGAAVALAVVFAGDSPGDLTSGRSALVTDTAAVAADHPLVGVGVSAQPRVTRREQAPDASKLQSVSHTTPLTVAAELGVLGVAAFLALLAGAGRALVEVGRSDVALALGLGAALLVLLVHSLFYPALFENPITWGALGVLAAATSRRREPGAGPDPGTPRSPLRSLPARR